MGRRRGVWSTAAPPVGPLPNSAPLGTWSVPMSWAPPPAGPLLKSAPAGIFASVLWVSVEPVSSAAPTVAFARPRMERVSDV